MSEEKFKLPGSSYDEVAKIIKAYGHADKPATNEDISKLTGLHTTMVSRNNGFLVAVGIVDGNTGRTKTPTTLGRKLARALEYDRADEISSAWRAIIEADEFLSKMLAAVRIRKGMDESTLENHIAYSAGLQKSSNVMAGASTVVAILRSSGLLQEREGRLVVTDIAQSTEDKESNIDRSGMTGSGIPTDVSSSHQEQLPKVIPPHMPVVNSNGQTVSVHIELRIDAKPSELDGLGNKLRQLLKELSIDNSQVEVEAQPRNEAVAQKEAVVEE